jgi:pimeloyl-ACP methyl ester carboxylesterase
MKKTVFFVALAVLFCCNAIGSEVHAVNYKTGTNTLFFSNPEKTQVFVSTNTKTPKGTVVILHGMILVNFEIYMDLIFELTDMGYDVIFPQYQEAGIGILQSMGLLALLGGDSPSHIEWTHNAIAGINWAKNAYVGYWYGWRYVIRKPSPDLYIYGHSVGGAIGYNIPLLSSDLKSKIKGIVLANAVVDPTALAAGTMPAGIEMPAVELIDVESAGDQINVPLLYLGGSEDDWADDYQASLFLDNAATSNKKQLTALSSDADHMAPATNQGPLFDILSWTGLTDSMLGGDAEWNSMDTQYYVPAILHLINGNSATSFNPAIAWE